MFIRFECEKYLNVLSQGCRNIRFTFRTPNYRLAVHTPHVFLKNIRNFGNFSNLIVRSEEFIPVNKEKIPTNTFIMFTPNSSCEWE